MKKNNTHEVIVVGGGASGILLSALLTRAGKDVLLLEKNDRIGKKILITGNGRCNLSNRNCQSLCYNAPDFIDEIYKLAKPSRVEEVLNEMGVVTFADDEGRVYPISNHSSSVLDAIRMWLCDDNVVTNTQITDITYIDNIYYIYTNDIVYKAKHLVLALGGEKNDILKNLNINLTLTSPALCGLKTKRENVSGLSGVRAKVQIKSPCHSEVGEVQFKDDGISGICTLNTQSKNLWNGKKNYMVYLDFLCDIKDKLSFVASRVKMLGGFAADKLLCGVLHKNISQKLLGLCEIKLNEKIEKIDNLKLRQLANLLENYPLEVNGTQMNAQVTHGGVSLDEIEYNFECKKHKNLFILGEMLNIDGLCGGFNLNFAFLSAIICSTALLEKI